MIKGLSITPPIVGRISIGRVVERNGKRLPEKDDQFTITSQVQTKDGWIPHPMDEKLRQHSDNGKLRTIPITLPFNDPDLNFRAEYTLFDRNSGRPLCAGDGSNCKRVAKGSMESLPCPSPSFCDIGANGNCKPYGRLNVRIGDSDHLDTFIFRTTGFNSIRTLIARLEFYKAMSGDLLACLPLELKLRGKSTTQSYRAAIYYVDISVRTGMSLEDAITQAQTVHQQRINCGFDQQALDDAARKGFENGCFEDNEEDGQDVIDEFYSKNQSLNSPTMNTSGSKHIATLGDKLAAKNVLFKEPQIKPEELTHLASK
jgi:hypothetical protein